MDSAADPVAVWEWVSREGVESEARTGGKVGKATEVETVAKEEEATGDKDSESLGMELVEASAVQAVEEVEKWKEVCVKL